MAKTYKILVNDGKGTDIKPVSVVQGASAKDEPVRMTAKRGWRFELQDDLKGKNLGPDQVRLKRMGKNLGLMFDGSVNPDVIIEDFYAENEDKEKDNGSPMIVGQAEDGGMYEYVPQDPAASSMASQLKDGNTPVIVALGGGPLAADFALAGLPLIAAAGGGIGGLLAGGAAVVAAAAAGGGGGGGGDTPVVVPATVAPTVDIDTDVNKDGYVNKAEVNGNTTYSTKTALPSTAVAGDTITVTDGTTTKTHVLTATDITNTFVSDTFTLPTEGSTITVTAKMTSAATGVSSANATDTAKLDATVPTNNGVNLAVKISTDGDDNGFVSNTELNGATTFTSRATFNNNVTVGDMVVFTAKNGALADIQVIRVLTATDKQNGFVDVTFPKPAEAATQTVAVNFVDAAGNAATDAKPTDNAKLDTTPPDNGIVDLAVRIITDVGPDAAPVNGVDKVGDNVVSKAELDAQSAADSNNFISRASFNSSAAVGDKIIFTAKNGTTMLPTQTFTLTSADITRGSVEAKFVKPESGQTQTVTAMYADAAGNADTSLPPSDFAKLDNTPPNGGAAPTVVITTDGANNGAIDEFVNNLEIGSSTLYSVDASFDRTKVALDDKVVFTVGSTVQEVTVTQSMLDAGKATTTFTAPTANGAAFTVKVVIKDAVGNSTEEGTDSATRNFLEAKDDANTVTAVTGTQVVTTSVNVFANDEDPQFLPNPTSPSVPKVVVSGIKLDGAASFTSLSSNGATVTGEFGILKVNTDGSYTYTLNDSDKVQGLGVNDTRIEKFVYEATDPAGNVSMATLSVSVKGVNDIANADLAFPDFLTLGPNQPNQPGDKDSLVISDQDLNTVMGEPKEASFRGVSTDKDSQSGFIGVFGELVLTQTSGTDTSTGYSFNYTKSSGLVKSTNTMRHDLFTFQSKDGSDSVTFDFQLHPTNAVNSHEYHAKSTAGLEISSASTTTKDTLVLEGTQLAFDFTGAASSTNIKSIEVVDITGGTTSNNTIKLDLNSLMQADVNNTTSKVHQLFINGNNGDAVNYLGDAVTSTQGTGAFSGYNIFRIDDTHELLVQQAISVTFQG